MAHPLGMVLCLRGGGRAYNDDLRWRVVYKHILEDTDWRDIREDLGAPYVSKHFITDVLQKFELDATAHSRAGATVRPLTL